MKNVMMVAKRKRENIKAKGEGMKIQIPLFLNEIKLNR